MRSKINTSLRRAFLCLLFTFFHPTYFEFNRINMSNILIQKQILSKKEFGEQIKKQKTKTKNKLETKRIKNASRVERNCQLLRQQVHIHHWRHWLLGQSAHRKTAALVSEPKENLFSYSSQKRQDTSATHQRTSRFRSKIKTFLIILLSYLRSIIIVFITFAILKMFDLVRKGNPEFASKLEAIEGDLDLPSIGISQEDEQKLIENVNVVFHSAATIRFDEPIKYVENKKKEKKLLKSLIISYNKSKQQ